ncbi:YozQ family protein [Bacillus massiliglaciei]|uniref:YozQ family protein n=1 Tax=Bacillus massiliglaciei TaxID=1816693 RepID=UPI000DA60CBF|nr:YozQ family protein [Bacillus massiliglaciei]
MNNKKVSKKDYEATAGKQYQPSDHEGESQIEQGTALTHEQVSDNYHEGTIDQLTESDKE